MEYKLKHRWRWAKPNERADYFCQPHQVMRICKQCGLINIRPRGTDPKHYKHFWFRGQQKWTNTGLMPIECQLPLDFQI